MVNSAQRSCSRPAPRRRCPCRRPVLLVEHVEPVGLDLDRLLVVGAEIAEARGAGRRLFCAAGGFAVWLSEPGGGGSRACAGKAAQHQREHRGQQAHHGRKLVGWAAMRRSAPAGRRVLPPRSWSSMDRLGLDDRAHAADEAEHLAVVGDLEALAPRRCRSAASTVTGSRDTTVPALKSIDAEFSRASCPASVVTRTSLRNSRYSFDVSKTPVAASRRAAVPLSSITSRPRISLSSITLGLRTSWVAEVP